MAEIIRTRAVFYRRRKSKMDALVDAYQLGAVDTVAELSALTTMADGDVVSTLRYSTSHSYGDGSANRYRYVSTDTTAVDGGFVLTSAAGRWHAVDKQSVMLEQFGAIGDGVSDDTTAVAAALTSGAKVIEAHGTYSCTALTISNAVMLTGTGRIVASGTVGSLITVSANDVRIDGVTIDGNNTTSVGISVSSDVTGFHLTNAEVKNIQTAATNASGVHLRDGCDDFLIQGCHIHHIHTTDGQPSRGIRISGFTDGTNPIDGGRVLGNHITNISPEDDADGVVVQDFTVPVHIVIDGNTFNHCAKRCIKVNTGEGVLVTGNHCRFDSFTDPDTTTHTTGVIGISIQDSGCIASNNIINGAWTGGITLTGTSSAKDNDIESTTLDIGIDLVSGKVGSGADISGNRIVGAIGTTRYGIQVNYQTTDVRINGNHIEACDDYAVYLSGNPVGVQVNGNTWSNIGSRFIHLASSEFVSVNGNTAIDGQAPQFAFVGGFASLNNSASNNSGGVDVARRKLLYAGDATPSVEDASTLILTTTTPWSIETGWGVSGGDATVTGGQSTDTDITQGDMVFVVGRDYTVTYTVKNYVAGNVRCVLGGGTETLGTNRSADGTYVETLTAQTGNNSIIFRADADEQLEIDNVSVSENNVVRFNFSSATTITDFDTEHEGQLLTLVFRDSGIVIAHDNTKIKLDAAANYTSGTNGGVMQLIMESGVWHEITSTNFA